MQPEQKPATPIAKIVFENVRNIFACVALRAAGVGIAVHPGLAPFGPRWAPGWSLLVLLISAGLLIWNAIAGTSELAGRISPRHWPFWLIAAPAFSLYFTIALTIYAAAVKAPVQSMLSAAKCAASGASRP